MFLTIFVKNYAIDLPVGVYLHEKGQRESILISITAETKIPVASIEDKIESTISYEVLVDAIERLKDLPHTGLLETLAKTLAADIFSRKAFKALHMTLEKPNMFKAADSVGVTLSFEGRP